jgi:hypothetical protein
LNGWDFLVLWEAGAAVLKGIDPYSVNGFFYPLPVACFLAPFGLFPYEIAFGLWLILNAALLLFFFRRLTWAWLLYAPVLHLFSSGQVEMLLWSLERFIYAGDRARTPGWRGAILVALITLKPQTAIVLLPWYGVHWLREDRGMLVRSGIATAALWGIPMLWRPRWILDWYAALSPAGFLTSAGNTPGLWSVAKIAPDLWPLILLVAVPLMAWGVCQTNAIARACALLAFPAGLFYSTFALLGTAPARILVPLSLLAVALTIVSSTFVPFLMLPLAVIVWNRWFKPAELPADLPLGHLYQNH